MEFGKEFIYEFAKRTLDNILLLEEEFRKEKIKNEVEVINDISQDEIDRGKKVFEEFGIDYKKY